MKSDWMRRVRILAVLLVAVAILAGFFATPHDPMSQEFIGERLAGPSAEHWLGVDGLGRDYFSRVWRGAANTFAMGTAGAAGAFLLAVVLLGIEQAMPRAVGRAILRAVGVWIAIPVLFVGLLLLVFLRPSPGTLVVAAAVGTTPLVFRQLRVLWREQKSAEYVRASVVLGAGTRRLVTGTIWPNLRPDVWALLRVVFALSVLELSGLAFLGLVGDPDFPELGALLRENQRYLFSRPSLAVWPGVVLSGLLLSVQFLGTRRRI